MKLAGFSLLLSAAIALLSSAQEPCVDTQPRESCTRLRHLCGRFRVMRDEWCRRTCGSCSSEGVHVAPSSGAARCAADVGLSQSTRQQFSSDANQLALRIYAEATRRASDENVFFSPTSIHIALGMLLMGAKSSTKAQMKQFLAPSLTDEQTTAAYEWLMNELNPAAKSYSLHTANNLFLDNELSMLEAFSQSMSQCFKSDAQIVDFDDNPEEIRADINEWVEGKTNDRIRDLIPPGALNSDTVLVLVNAIYFKADWLIKFSDGGNTYDGHFYPLASPRRQKAQKMMHMKAHFLYNEGEDVQVLGLPYEDNELTMFILLPTAKDGISAVERRLSSDDLTRLLDGARKRVVRATIPKFTFTQTLPLKDILESIGMTHMFSRQRADLSGISGDRNLVVSDAIHKAFIEVNEKGTEAAAATAILVEATSAQLNPPPIFMADHAFLFVIRHEATGQFLFMGRFAG